MCALHARQAAGPVRHASQEWPHGRGVHRASGASRGRGARRASRPHRRGVTVVTVVTIVSSPDKSHNRRASRLHRRRGVTIVTVVHRASIEEEDLVCRDGMRVGQDGNHRATVVDAVGGQRHAGQLEGGRQQIERRDHLSDLVPSVMQTGTVAQGALQAAPPRNRME